MSIVTIPPIGTKTSVPGLPDRWLTRPRLNDRCSRVGPREALLVAAFAGSGKSTLLADWFTNDCEIGNRAWLTLDARDNAPGRLSKLLACALQVEQGAFDDLDGRHCSDTVVLDRIFEQLESRAQPTVLVLDDVHELTSRQSIAALSHLLMRLPPTLSVFMAARADPPLPLARLHVDGRLHQIRTHDLALTHAETAELFELHDAHVEATDIESLRARTGGWVSGLRLAATALAEQADPGNFVENVVHTESLISDFLVHEVLDSQPAEVRRFLLRTCLARPLTAELASELSGDPYAEERLAQLERGGLFVSHQGDSTTSYQFHALFGDLLRARIRHDEPDVARSLLTRAARWFVAHDMPLEAEHHAYEARNFELAGALSCRRFVHESLNGGWMTPGEHPVSAAETAEVPELALIAAANAIAVLERRDALMWRSRLDALLAAEAHASSAPRDPSFDAARLLLDVFYGRAFGTDARARASCQALLDLEIGPDTRMMHAVARLRQAELLLDTEHEDDEGTLRALLDARWRASRNASPWVVDECDILLGLIASLRGCLDSCETLLQGIPPRDDRDPVSDTRRLARALCDAQRGRSGTARKLLVSDPSPLAAHAVRIGIEVAIRRLDAHNDSRSPIEQDRDQPFAVRVQVALGAIDGPHATFPESVVAAARVLLSRNRDEQVLAVLQPLTAERATRDHLRTRIEAMILSAIAADRLGDHALALASLQRALDLAAPADLRAPFLAYSELLAGMIDRYSWQLAGSSAYAAELVDDLHPEELPVFVEPLTSRELAVLEYLPTMMTNTEIARHLLVSVNTVKTHLKSVYRKLGVERRRDAVVLAKQLEIL